VPEAEFQFDRGWLDDAEVEDAKIIIMQYSNNIIKLSRHSNYLGQVQANSIFFSNYITELGGCPLMFCCCSQLDAPLKSASEPSLERDEEMVDDWSA
jgi:hypothetical protein